MWFAQEVLRSQLAGLSQLDRPPARVLNVAGPGEVQLARAGHVVTGIDASSAELLAAFDAALASAGRGRRPGPAHRGAGQRAPDLVTGAFDVVLCHGVLMYLDDITPMLTALSQVAEANGAISLLVRNGLATSMRDGLRGDWPAALAAFDSKDYVNRLGLRARAHAPADIDEVLGPLGWQRQMWFGVRVFTDHRDKQPSGPSLDEDWRPSGRPAAVILADVAALLHLVYGQMRANDPGNR